MRPLTSYISFLLMTRHYVFVPGHGAYMLSEQPSASPEAPADNQAHVSHSWTLTPPRRVVVFNAMHPHNDGMLANLLMEAEGLSFDAAMRYIERHAPHLPADLLDRLQAEVVADHYGFAPVTMSTWSSLEHPVQPTTPVAADSRQAEVIAIPRYWLRRVAVVALIICCFFASYVQLDDHRAPQYAAMLDVTRWQRSAADVMTAELLADTLAVPSQPQAQVTDVQTQEAATPATSPSAPASAKSYYIVVASCATPDDARKTLERLEQKGLGTLHVLERDGRYRLYIDCLDQREAAEQRLLEVRQDDRTQKAWLLPVRNNMMDQACVSSSIIIKNIYNDNQLSLEMSHPNQRTERDQG